MQYSHNQQDLIEALVRVDEAVHAFDKEKAINAIKFYAETMLRRHLKVKPAMPESPRMTTTFGISEQRAKELSGLVADELILWLKLENAGRAILLVQAARHCETANEIAFVSYFIGMRLGKGDLSIGDIDDILVMMQGGK